MTTPLPRRHDWPERLAEFFESRRPAAFAWGNNNCALFAADAVLAMTDIDLAEGWRELTERKALARMRKLGGMAALASNLAPKKVGFAQRGDVVLVAIDGRETYGVVCGNGFWCAPGADGLVFRPMSEVESVFGF